MQLSYEGTLSQPYGVIAAGMDSTHSFTRRAFLAAAAAGTIASAAEKFKRVPVGLELFSVRDDLNKDLLGTVRRVGQMGYEGVEFYSPYFDWTPEQAKEVRKVMNEVNLKCWSTHNGAKSFDPANIQKAIDLNGILGSKMLVMASAGRVEGLDGWKKVAETLSAGQQTLKKAGMKAGFHNHQLEFKPIEGKRPMEVLAENTPKDVCLQLDVGTCIEAGSDPVAWINANPGRINSLHLKEWSKDKAYEVLFAEGVAPWKEIFRAAEKTGGAQFYYIEQEGYHLPPFETAEKCLANFKKLRGET
jgi:sugar phosphate isomerase/epimerase